MPILEKDNNEYWETVRNFRDTIRKAGFTWTQPEGMYWLHESNIYHFILPVNPLSKNFGYLFKDIIQAKAYFCANPSIMKKVAASILIVAMVSFFFLKSCTGKDSSSSSDPMTSVAPAVPVSAVSIVQSYPHDTSSFTEGFLIYKGAIYESTGNYGYSKLLMTKLANIRNGKPDKQIKLDDKYFGEGISIIRDTIYQLTYKEHVVFVYTLDFKKIREMPLKVEGWGMTTDGTNLIASANGSNILYYFDPATFKLLKTQNIYESGSVAYNLNELEFIDGYIYANQWELPYILKIDPKDGTVVSKIDLSTTWDRAKQLNPNADVPNGIAYDGSSKKVFVTGKWWPEMYEISLGK
jgi:glutamine cyclotransferase